MRQKGLEFLLSQSAVLILDILLRVLAENLKVLSLDDLFYSFQVLSVNTVRDLILYHRFSLWLKGLFTPYVIVHG